MILTATFDAIGGYVDAFHRYASAYPRAGYGLRFRLWAQSGDRSPYGSWGNGAAMRVSPVGLLFRDDPALLWEQARLSALPTHLHPLGIEGAQLSRKFMGVCVARSRRRAFGDTVKDSQL